MIWVSCRNRVGLSKKNVLRKIFLFSYAGKLLISHLSKSTVKKHVLLHMFQSVCYSPYRTRYFWDDIWKFGILCNRFSLLGNFFAVYMAVHKGLMIYFCSGYMTCSTPLYQKQHPYQQCAKMASIHDLLNTKMVRLGYHDCTIPPFPALRSMTWIPKILILLFRSP